MTDEKRKLKIEGMVCLECEQKIKEALQKLNGVRTINADYKTGEIIVEYDVLRTSLKEIESNIESLGYNFPSGFFSKLKRGFIHYTDKTARENYLIEKTQGPKLDCCTLNKNKAFKDEKR